MTAVTTTIGRGTTAEHELAQLQREHGRPLFALLLRLCDGDRQRAEDLVQETFVRAWQHPEALRAHDFTSVRPWLLTVARRLAIDARRARQARPAEVGDAVLENARVCADHAERSAATLDVRDAVKTLTPEHREVLVQVYFRGRVWRRPPRPWDSARYREVPRVLRAARPAPGSSGIRGRPAVKPKAESNLRKAPC